jgi:hypothetical protein
MTINLLNSKWIALALLSLAAVSGCCCQAVPLPGENQCPTDARRLYLSCGEEAVRRCPCGPGSEFYGLKPTCWREWPVGWHCNGCEGMPYVDRALCGEPVTEAPGANEEPNVAAPPSPHADVTNPFRSKPGAADLPLPPQTRSIPPTQSAPANTVPLQPMLTKPPALEKVPTEFPPSTKSTMDGSTDQETSVLSAPPIAHVVQAEATVPQPMAMPFVPEAIIMPAPAPVLNAPLNAPKIASVAEPDPKSVRVASSTEAEKKQPAKKTAISKTKNRPDDPAISGRVEQHLINNLRL